MGVQERLPSPREQALNFPPSFPRIPSAPVRVTSRAFAVNEWRYSTTALRLPPAHSVIRAPWARDQNSRARRFSAGLCPKTNAPSRDKHDWHRSWYR